VNVVTQPFPGFPTDMQAQMIAVCTIADGTSVVEDTIYTIASRMSRNWRAWARASS
jgi:UDP-N-acetylglucosamine enolpyruvyl transferase